jgi:hypothetical protein
MTEEKTARLNVSIPLSLFVDFKKSAVDQMFQRSVMEQVTFSQRYVQLSTIEALKIWVGVKKMDPELLQALYEIESKEFRHISDRTERHTTMMLQALKEFVINHKID